MPDPNHAPSVIVDALSDGCRILVIYHATVAEYDAIARALHSVDVPILGGFDAELLRQRIIRKGGKNSPTPENVRREKAQRADELRQLGRSWKGIARQLHMEPSTIRDWWKESSKKGELPNHTARNAPDNQDRRE